MSQAKILSQAPTELELQVAQAFIDLENNSPELKADLRALQFKSIREVCETLKHYKKVVLLSKAKGMIEYWITYTFTITEMLINIR